QSAYNLMRIVNDILDYSKLAAGKLTLNEEVFSLRDCIDSANAVVLPLCHENENELHLVSYQEDIDIPAADNNKDIRYTIPDYVIGDYHRLRQILINVLSNATKFTRKGHIYTSLSLPVSTTTPTDSQDTSSSTI